jgi:hypothetical protein
MARSMLLVSRLNINPPVPQKRTKVGPALSPVNPRIAAGLATKLCACQPMRRSRKCVRNAG